MTICSGAVSFWRNQEVKSKNAVRSSLERLYSSAVLWSDSDFHQVVFSPESLRSSRESFRGENFSFFRIFKSRPYILQGRWKKFWEKIPVPHPAGENQFILSSIVLNLYLSQSCTWNNSNRLDKIKTHERRYNDERTSIRPAPPGWNSCFELWKVCSITRGPTPAAPMADVFLVIGTRETIGMMLLSGSRAIPRTRRRTERAVGSRDARPAATGGEPGGCWQGRLLVRLE